MKLQILASAGAIFAAAAIAMPAWAHLALVSPSPRSAGIDDGYSAEGPCGNYPPTGHPTVFHPGDTITIAAHVNPHTNSYRVALSPPGDMGFEENVIGIFDAMPDENDDIQFDVKLPDEPCPGCTLQVVMWDAGWYACADVDILAEGMPPTQPGATSGSGSPSGTSGGGAAGGEGGAGDVGTSSGCSASPRTSVGDLMLSVVGAALVFALVRRRSASHR